MLFSSKEFLFLFLPIAALVFVMLRRYGNYRLCQLWIMSASLFFYGWSDVRQVPVLLGSVLFNYVICSWLYRLNTADAKTFLMRMVFWTGIIGNLALLGYYKYAVWLTEVYAQLTGVTAAPLGILQPIGISFYTIMQIMVLVDAYEGDTERAGFMDYFTSVTFFPCLLSGPILQPASVWAQFREQWSKPSKAEQFVGGISLFSIGLVKKAAIADSLAQWANSGFEMAGSLTVVEAWTVALCYTLQLYFDFSGYTDMAVGLGRMFGISLPVNFNTPFRSRNLIEFWQRWHMSLSSFITGYVYIPIARWLPAGFGWSLQAILAAMLISGLWHGANWTFVVWGGLHGLAIAVNHLWARTKIRLGPAASWSLTFVFILLTFVIFRARNIDEAITMYKDLFGQHGLMLPAVLADKLGFLNSLGIQFGAFMTHIDPGMTNRPLVFGLTFLVFAVFFQNSDKFVEEMQPTLETAIIIAVVFAIGLFHMISATHISKFLYFQF